MLEAKEVKDLIIASEKIVITSHKSPDGDSIGSSMALFHYLKKLGKKPVICHPDPRPAFIDWVVGDVDIITFDQNPEKVQELMIAAELIFCLDYNGSNRLGKDMGDVLDKCSAKKVMIDHHPNPDEFVDVAISVPTTCSTCQLIYEVIVGAGDRELIDAQIGEAIYLGIMTDTGSFRFSSVEPRTHEILAHLLSVGVNHTLVHENTFDNVRIDKLKLRGYATSEKLEVIPELGVAIISLTDPELEKFNYIKGDTEGLVNVALSVEGVKAAVFLAEKDGLIKMSFRSKGDLAINKLAVDHFSGGGHINAAGGISELSMEDTILKLKKALADYV